MYYVYCIFWDGRVRTGILDIPGFTGVTGSFLILVGVTGSLFHLRYGGLSLHIYGFNDLLTIHFATPP